MKNLNELEKNLGVIFRKQSFLKQALTHRSYLNESADKYLCSNERGEFLGDAVLSFIVSYWLYDEFSGLAEGDLTNLRSALVKTNTLARISQRLRLGEYLFLSRGESDSDGASNPVLLANCLEAIIAAVFLDSGLERAIEFVKTNFKPLLEDLIKSGKLKDYKSLLQEKLQAKIKKSPVYKTLTESGPPHAKSFTVGVFCENELISTGIGKSKQEAEEEAASAALEKLNFKG